MYSSRNYRKQKQYEVFLSKQLPQQGSCLISHPSQRHPFGSKGWVLTDPNAQEVEVLWLHGRSDEPSHIEIVNKSDVRVYFNLAKNFNILKRATQVELDGYIGQLNKQVS